jgi:hypothetical protein
VWGEQHTAPAAAARAAERVAQCEQRLLELRERRPVGPDHVARAQAFLLVARSRADAAEGRLLLTRARTARERAGGYLDPTGSSDSLEALRNRVWAIGLHEVYVAAFGVGSTTGLFDFEAFAHGLAGLPDAEIRIIEQAAWELEHF